MATAAHTEHQACLLLGVWGEKYIHDFLELGLPSLLAPGNIPALADAYPTRFVFLTQSYDEDIFRAHPAFNKLQQYCQIEFQDIDDLVTLGNYSTTLTFAYDRAIRATGKAMLDTYFLFLTSDYIMADGSLKSVIRQLKKGVSGVCAGNFQVIQEHMEPYLRKHIDPATHTLQLSPRELVKESLQHLHPITITSFYEDNRLHNYRINRFFLHENEHVLAGRFFLLHMLCVKPETMDYQIGASCDYSFIPEMCPSGNIAIINDSDDYFVAEIQPKSHELNYLHWGPFNLKKLTHALAEWTTEQHRENIKHTIYYHTGDLSDETKSLLDKKLDSFTSVITAQLDKHEPQPYRGHPYWIGEIQGFNQYNLLINNKIHFDFSNLAKLQQITTFKQIYYKFFGKSPNVYPWHFSWLRYRATMKAIKRHLRPAAVIARNDRESDVDSHGNAIVLYDSYQLLFMRYCRWLKDSLNINHHYHTPALMRSPNLMTSLKNEPFDTCINFIKVSELNNVQKYLSTIKSLLKPNGKIVLIISNDNICRPSFFYDFKREFAANINKIKHSEYNIANITTIHDNFSLFGNLAIERISTLINYNKKLRILSFLLLGIPGSLVSLARNLTTLIKPPKSGHCTDILVTLTPNEFRGEAA